MLFPPYTSPASLDVRVSERPKLLDCLAEVGKMVSLALAATMNMSTSK